MVESIFYALLAILGLGFLVFIHEFGHYWAARKQGMRVEAFAIGFGKPIFTWERKGVKWHICCLPFGGYVRIAGMQKEGSREPYEIVDGFYGKRPWQRIQVALAGPFVNIAFAALAFVFLWIAGGRDKSFSELTHRIGWVDPQSPLFAQGVRPGDEISRYDGKEFQGFKDLLIAGVLDGKTTRIQGYKMDPITGEKTEFDYTLPTYQDPRSPNEKLLTIGVLSPAQYLIVQQPNLLPSTSPMANSGLESNDRIVWVDGEKVFSAKQLSALINESTAFLTVQREGKTFHVKIPRVRINDLKVNPFDRAEIDDWQHEAELKGRLQELFFIPYALSPFAGVERPFDFIDEEDQTAAFQSCERSPFFTPLQEGDQIIAVNGKPIQSSYELLREVQERRALIIVERNPELAQKLLWTQAEVQFDPGNFEPILSSIGTKEPILSSGHFHLLRPIAPKTFAELPLTPDQKSEIARNLADSKKEIEAIQDSQKRLEELRALEKNQGRLALGISLKDREVLYNPPPQQQFFNVFQDTWRTIVGLFSGVLNPKYISGPIGIVHVVHHSWMVGAKEALFWLGVISLNLGFINLLPIPILDGGHILFSAIEMVTKRPLRAKTMERLIIPFIGLLVAVFVYITYQDIVRLFSKFF